MTSQEQAPSITQGRLFIVLAAVLWSTSGFFSKALTRDTPLHLNDPPVHELVMAAARVFFAGIVLTPFLRVRDISFRPMMLFTAIIFAIMNASYISAMTLGDAGSAVFLQYTAPMWLYLIGGLLLREPTDRRGPISLVGGLAGIALILYGSWAPSQILVIGLGLLSGITFALVLIGLRTMRDASSRWLTVVNHLFAALVMLPVAWSLPRPTFAQLVMLMVFGSLQLGIPYWLMARGLRSVSSQEAGMLTLIEPVLVPVWAYLTAGEKPGLFTLLGGACILGALAFRYWPRNSQAAVATAPPHEAGTAPPEASPSPEKQQESP